MSLSENNGAGFQETSAINEKQPPKRSIWFWINILIAVFEIFSGAFLLCLATFGITLILFPFFVIINVILAILYKKYQKNKKGKILLNTMRIAALAVMAIIQLSPMAIINFRNTPNAYPLKKIVYTYGVGHTERCRQIFPKWLPKNCEDYTFITQGQSIAQDYHASAYLIFHTDGDTLRQYEERISALGIAERFENTPKNPKDYYDDDDNDEYKEMMYIQMNRPDMLPGHVYDRFCDDISDDLGNAVIYYVHDYYSKGCMFNYETGLAVFWV